MMCMVWLWDHCTTIIPKTKSVFLRTKTVEFSPRCVVEHFPFERRVVAFICVRGNRRTSNRKWSSMPGWKTEAHSGLFIRTYFPHSKVRNLHALIWLYSAYSWNVQGGILRFACNERTERFFQTTSFGTISSTIDILPRHGGGDSRKSRCFASFSFNPGQTIQALGSLIGNINLWLRRKNRLRWLWRKVLWWI